MNVRRNAGIADGTYEDRVEIAGEHCKTISLDSGAVFKVTVRAPIEVREFEWHAGGFKDPYGLGYRLFAYAVSGNDGYFFARHA